MKLGDVVQVTSGPHAGEKGKVFRLMGGWVDFVRADGRGIQERGELCEVIQPDTGANMFAREHAEKVE